MQDTAPRGNRLISEDEMHRAMEYLRNSAFDLGKLSERQRKAEKMIGHVEALQFKMSSATSADAKKADARASDAYVDAITEDAVSTGELRKLYALREAAQAVVDAWRTQEASNRQYGRAMT